MVFRYGYSVHVDVKEENTNAIMIKVKNKDGKKTINISKNINEPIMKYFLCYLPKKIFHYIMDVDEYNSTMGYYISRDTNTC